MSLGKELDGREANLAIIGSFGAIFNIPYTDIVLNFAKIWRNYQASTIHNKLVDYMDAIERMTPNDREHLKLKIENNKNFRRDVVSVLMEMIDNVCTDMNIDVLANITHALAEGNISTDDFYRLSLTLRRCIYSDLEKLVKYREASVDGSGYLDRESQSSTFCLYSAGFLYMPVIGGEYNFVVNDLGEKMIKFGLKISI